MTTVDATAREVDVKALTAKLSAAFAEDSTVMLRDRGDQLARALRRGGIGGFEARSPLAACLLPLLDALGWQGSMREITEALPHYADSLDFEELLNTLAELGYRTVRIGGGISGLDHRLLPVLLLGRDGGAKVVLDTQGEAFRVYCGDSRQELLFAADELDGDLHIFQPTAEDEAPASPSKKNSWVFMLVRRFKRTIGLLLAISFALNLLSLVVPLFIMTLYDRVIPARAHDLLFYLAIGAALALLAETALRLLRARLIAHVGGRFEYLIATSTFGHILKLPAPLTENAPVGTQAARLREFDAIRDLFTGPMVSVALELPFVLVFLAVIAMLGGPLAYIPLALIGVYLIIGFSLLPGLKRNVAKSSRMRAQRHSFLVEMTTHVRAIKQLSAEKIWSERFRQHSAQASHAHFRTAQLSFMLQTAAQAIMMAAGIATVAFGTVRVIDGLMTIGALIAVMALVWRVLSPLQNLFLALTRFEQAKQSIAQIDQLMALPAENLIARKRRLARKFTGTLSFDRVSFRYRNDADPALLGVSFSVGAGDMLGIMGTNGAGKSTVLSLAAGLYRPQAGVIRIDGVDIRQMDTSELRQAIGFVPQDCQMFHGTIAQNLRLARPTASDGDLRTACAKIGILGSIEALPDGFNTRIGDQRVAQLSSGFKQSLSIARIMLRRPEILLLDEAARALDAEADTAFIKMLAAIKGKSTVVLVSHRPSHLRLCDQVMLMQNGMVTALGAADDILKAATGKAA